MPRAAAVVRGVIFSVFFLAFVASVSLSAQCTDWPVGCPTVDDFAIADSSNTPMAGSPGHTDEEICSDDVNETKEGQLDLTASYLTIDADLVYLRAYYNDVSAASTTQQFWFFDIDNNPATGGSDAVRPFYQGQGQNPGPGPCVTQKCTTPFLSEEHATGYEYYVHSYDQSVGDFAIFKWDDFFLVWVEQPQPAGTLNLQGAEDNPHNAYAGKNGYRGIAMLPKGAIGITDTYFTLFVRSFSCEVCCGDNHGGEGIVLLPGMRPCESDLCGDCDANGFVNILDAFRAAHHDAGLATLNDNEFSNCNVAGALGPSLYATVSILDALTIARFVVGLTTLQCCVCCIP